jgi:hypothetical protein
MISSSLPLETFAGEFGRDLRHHLEVNEEEVAGAFRQFVKLAPFPNEAALRSACRTMGIQVGFFPDSNTTLRAANVWHRGDAPRIYLNRNLRGGAIDRLLGHELRELIEDAFKRTNSRYEGLDTRDNFLMNPVSERFVDSLLLPARSSVLLLRELDFDPIVFSRVTSRPLPSVLVRMEQLLCRRRADGCPRAGFWLFEAPWPLVCSGKSRVLDLSAKYWAILNGFPQRQGGPLDKYLQYALLPFQGRPIGDLEFLSRSLQAARPLCEDFHGFAAAGYDCTFIGEPCYFNGRPWRMLVCVVLQPDTYMLNGWLDRLGMRLRNVPGSRPALATKEVA